MGLDVVEYFVFDVYLLVSFVFMLFRHLLIIYAYIIR